jgi:hypothetical protein
VRFLAIAALVALAGCADQSKGASLAECRMQYYLEDPAAQGAHIPDCMRAKSFEWTDVCNPPTDDQDWDWQVATFAFDNPNCYRPIGSTAWMASVLSPM